MNIDPFVDIIPRLKNPDDARRVFNHKLVRAIYAVKNHYRFVPSDDAKPRTLKGLTSVLCKAYWPNLHEMRPTADQQRIKRLDRRPSNVGRDRYAKKQRIENRLLPKVTGHLRGTIVHQQMYDLIMFDAQNVGRNHEILGGTGYGKPERHPWVDRLMERILARGDLPLKPEFLVADPEIGIATQIDLVTVNEQTGQLSFYEYKTASSREYFQARESGPFSRFLEQRLENSPYTRAMLQASIGALMAMQMLNLQYDFKVIVAVVTDTAVDIIDIGPKFLLETAADVYADLRTFMKNKE